ADLVAMPQSDVSAVLKSLEAQGLVSRAVGERVAYRPADPGIALQRLILRQQQRLEDAKIAVGELQDRIRRPEGKASLSELFEVIRGREGVRERFEQLQLS